MVASGSRAKEPARLPHRIHVTVIAAVAVLSSAAALAGGPYLELARVSALAALLVQVIVDLRAGRSRFMTSPLFLLSIIGVLFFSVFQRLWKDSGQLVIATFVGSPAEGIILAFCMTCLVFYLIASHLPLATKSKFSNRHFVPLFVLAACVSCFDITLYYLKSVQAPVPHFLANAHFIVPPLISICLCLLVRSAPARGRFVQLAVFFLIIATLGGLVYVREGKIVLFMLAAVSAYATRVFELSFKHLILAAIAALLIALAFGYTIQQTRWLVSFGPNPPSRMYFVNFKSKAVYRQTETGYCLDNVLKKHAAESFAASKQLFWLKGLVPGVLWPDKPTLSMGKEYAIKYCLRLERKSTLGDHSSSITLLGQPLIHGGVIGLIVHAGLLLLGLAIIERFNTNPKALSAAMVTALLPWLMDFDQDFAMYIANAAKFAVVMAIVFIPIVLIERRATALDQQ